MYFLYILECVDKSLYTGITTDIDRRFKEHVDGKGGNYTRSHRVRKIVYTEESKNRSTALVREAEIKKLTKKKKIMLIQT